jgi:hypothetical protein
MKRGAERLRLATRIQPEREFSEREWKQMQANGWQICFHLLPFISDNR